MQMMIGENYPLNASGAAKVTTSFLLVINPPGVERLRCK
ncbi:hypothetical protein EC12741_A0314 [Escherichia coli 1.2741]|nr:hypothetical protein EC12741_A0314 [Escherichia coli 1.2741]